MFEDIKRFWVKGLALLMAVLLLAALACGDDDDEDDDAAAAAAVPTQAAVTAPTQAAPVVGAAGGTGETRVGQRPAIAGVTHEEMEGAKYGGILRLFLERGEPDMSPTRTAPSGEVLQQGLYSKLLMWDRFNPTSSIPDLASSWEVSDDGTVYTFNLRNDVTWHDGTPFTAHDVKATHDHSVRIWKDFGRGRRWGGFLSNAYESSRVIDDHTYEVTLQFPFADFIGLITSSQLRILPKHKIDEVVDQTEWESIFDADNPPVGTGPFQYKKFIANLSIEADRNPNFYLDYKGNQLPFLDGFEAVTITDKALQLAAFAAGRIDVWPAFPSMTTSEKDALVAQNGDKLKVNSGTTILNMATWFNPKDPLTGDPEFRKAILLALDLDEMTERIYEGFANLGFVIDPAAFPADVLPEAEMAQVPWIKGTSAERQAEATLILQGLGYATPADVPTLTVVAQNSSPFRQSAEVKAALLNAFGIRTNVQIFPPAVAFAMTRDRGEHHIWDMGIGTPVLTPLGIIQGTYHTENDSEFSRWTDQTGELAPEQLKVMNLTDQYVRELDTIKRRNIMFDIQRVILFEAPGVKVPTGFPGAWTPQWAYVKGHFAGAGLYEGQQHLFTWLDK